MFAFLLHNKTAVITRQRPTSLCWSQRGIAVLTVAAGMFVATPQARAQITGTLSGRFYYDSTQSITSVGVPGSTTTTSAFYYIANHATPTGTFSASTMNYTGNDTTLIKTFLGSTTTDATSYSGDTAKTLQDGILDIKGTITFSSAATYSFTTASDDGSAVFIGGTEVVNNDGTHGNTSVTGSYTASAAGSKTFEIVYFNHNYNNGTGQENFTFTSPTGVTYSSAALPEPGALALFALGTVTFFKRKQSKQQTCTEIRV